MPLSVTYFIVEILVSLSYSHYIPCPKGRNWPLHLGVVNLYQEVQMYFYFLEHFVTVNKESFQVLYFSHFATELVYIPLIWQYFPQSG